MFAVCVAMQLLPDETLDTLKGGTLKIIQHRDGYRFSLDPVLLCSFASVADGERVLDLGCGGGIMAMLLAQRYPACTCVGVEIQPRQVERAQRSVALNALEERVEIHCADARQLQAADFGTFKRVVCNPPFRSVASGRCSHGDERCLARHELCGGVADFAAAAGRVLEHGGTLAMIHLAERLVDVLAAMRGAAIEPKRLRMVHSRPGDGARLLLVEGRKGGRADLSVEAPLYIYSGDEYSAEVQQMYRCEEPV